jgi:glycosyltransferase involved in cell wall biosynthesis
VSVVGGSVFSKVGGMQLAIRSMLEFLLEEGRLSQVFLRFDNPEDIPDVFRPYVRCFSGSAVRFVFSVLLYRLTHRNLFWLCDHVNYAPLIALITLRRRFVVVGHAYELTLGVSRLNAWALKRAGWVVCVSAFTKKLCRTLGVAEMRLEVCHLGVDVPIKPCSVDRASRFEVLFVGRMDEAYKGQDHLIHAAVILSKRFPLLTINLVGGGSSLESYRSLAKELGVDAFMNIPGYVSDQDLEGYYQRADVFAMPSQCEGFGLVFVEAMARGIPCISSNEDAAQEIILHGETGYCVPYGDVPSLVAAIDSMLSDNEKRRVMGARSRERYLDQFTRSAFKRRFTALIDRMTSCVE